ncbi:MAG TPA: cyclopropane-fatty-acyl-phospholipid synthase family protein [Gammaproteobacteria bacterium]|nr:cyclopropane-fatty-acyl-phospholipid synthase family protein [Gammaproteobacteria bacterium]
MLAANTGKHLLLRLANRISAPVILELWDGDRIPLSNNPAVVFKLTSPAALRYVLKPSLSTLGEAFVEGYIDIEGALCDIIRAGEQMARGVDNRQWRNVLRHLYPHTRNSDSEVVSYHYDVSNDFYALWLDRNMVYSCAYYQTGEEDIHTAQEQKLEHICRKLRLKPGDRLLDIGCGWGGLIRWAAKHHGVQATGITLSENQFSYARERIEREGLSGHCTVLKQDYRDIEGEARFDKIVSVGMFEHVGLKNLPLYFATAHRLLADGGIFLNHGITAMDPDSRAVGLGAGDFIERYVFPHGELPHLTLAVDIMSRQGFEVVDVESLRRHYARTLTQWTERLEARREAALLHAGQKRYRIWQLYLAGCAHAFERRWISIHQVLATKNSNPATFTLPWTRADLYH